MDAPVYGYLRVSTYDQDHGVDAQKSAIERTVDVDAWFEERASGKDLDGRPVFTELLDKVCNEGATLVVSKLDRLGRSVIDILGVFEQVQLCGAKIRILDMGIDTTTPAGEMILTVMAAFAQFERRMIGERTKAGLAAARAKGVKLGRPANDYTHALITDLLLDNNRLMLSVKDIAKEAGVSVRTVQRIKKSLGA